MDEIYDDLSDLYEETCFDGSRFCDGKYEILFASIPIPAESDDSLYWSAVQCLNGADVKHLETDLKYEINWKEVGRFVNSISFRMPRDNMKLGDLFATSPYGLFKKNRTGIGATTLELSSPRNSIIVVPTRALAVLKAQNSEREGTGRYNYLYVAGDSESFGFPSISDYLLDDSIIFKKFIVVADSLPKLLREIGEENFFSYFLMIDEIDSYQYDGTYRPNLENVIDYYFQFPESKRCLVSATVGNFSDERITNEPVINITFNEHNSRDIKLLLHTKNVTKSAVEQILNIREQYPNDKILIAYNSVQRGILPIIENLREHLGEQLANDCAVLCNCYEIS